MEFSREVHLNAEEFAKLLGIKLHPKQVELLNEMDRTGLVVTPQGQVVQWEKSVFSLLPREYTEPVYSREWFRNKLEPIGSVKLGERFLEYEAMSNPGEAVIDVGGLTPGVLAEAGRRLEETVQRKIKELCNSLGVPMRVLVGTVDDEVDEPVIVNAKPV